MIQSDMLDGTPWQPTTHRHRPYIEPYPSPISSALLKPLLAAEMAASEHVFRLLFEQNVPTFVDADL